ncbi:hypothetical protein F4561_001797 [Lipingzhangella halophila]|uniref:DUF397 domain-containing protein n=1 Tax=Lipingzhangella halophila TaxID=1783352 RepID=A0A7W7RFD4_9ACTN|nr:DUF397 domain-containing protein [Lipingzhangella halophila]MBB4930977.1 hypothetical protein [Lipingzhangella halophila]
MSTESAAHAGRSGEGGDDHTPAAALPPGRSLGPGWRKSSYSEGQAGGGCVQIARDPCGAVLLGDSRTPEGPAVRVTGPAWCAFLRAVRNGELD